MTSLNANQTKRAQKRVGVFFQVRSFFGHLSKAENKESLNHNLEINPPVQCRRDNTNIFVHKQLILPHALFDCQRQITNIFYVAEML